METGPVGNWNNNLARMPQGARGPLRGERSHLTTSERLASDPRSRNFLEDKDFGNATKFVGGFVLFVAVAGIAILRSPGPQRVTRHVFATGRGHNAKNAPWRSDKSTPPE